MLSVQLKLITAFLNKGEYYKLLIMNFTQFKNTPYLKLYFEVARVRSHVRLCGIYGVQSGIVAGFLRVLLVSHSTDYSVLINNHLLVNIT